jgi:hypothetical protein
MRTTAVTMTPQNAATLLANNPDNRPLRPYRVAALADAIRRGEWQTTHQGIAIAPDGRLLDGQHRLAAIVAADRAVPLLVSYDVPHTAYAVIDTGARRTAGDIGRAAGYNRDAMNAGRIIIAREQAPTSVWSGSNIYGQATPQQIIDRLDQWDHDTPRLPDGRQGVNDVARLCAATASRMGRPGARSVLTAHWLLTEWHTPDRHELYMDMFIDRIGDGANLDHGDPRLTYRNWARAAPRLRAQEHLAKLTMTWNAHITGRPLKQLKWTGPAMPALANRQPDPTT